MTDTETNKTVAGAVADMLRRMKGKRHPACVWATRCAETGQEKDVQKMLDTIGETLTDEEVEHVAQVLDNTHDRLSMMHANIEGRH